jgi:hypothetical protein
MSISNQQMTLAIEEIKHLAEFAGLRVHEMTDEDKEFEITITPCPQQGVEGDNGVIIHSRHIAYFEEYPEEGVFPLGS